MKTRPRMGVLAVALAALLGGCDDATAPDPVGEVPAGEAVAVAQAPETSPQASVAHPYDMYAEGESRIVGWCDESAGSALVQVTGTGTMPHVGRFTTEQTNCLDVATGALTDGQGVVFAANGDELHLIYSGRVLPGVVPQTLELTYLNCGGTGRFAHAEGELDMVVVYSSETDWTAHGDGWLTYEASDRADR